MTGGYHRVHTGHMNTTPRTFAQYLVRSLVRLSLMGAAFVCALVLINTTTPSAQQTTDSVKDCWKGDTAQIVRVPADQSCPR